MICFGPASYIINKKEEMKKPSSSVSILCCFSKFTNIYGSKPLGGCCCVFSSKIAKCFSRSEFCVLLYADSKTLKEEKREELFESLKADESIGWAVDVIDPRELSDKMLRK